MNHEAIMQQLDLLPEYLGNHLLLTLLALSAGILVCVPFGLIVTRIRFLQWPALTIAGVLQTIPGLALLALMVPLLGTIGFLPAILALILYSFLPILRNTVTGVNSIDPAVTEAARGIGMTDRQMLIKVELPLALPVIIAGIRTAAVWVVGTATLATPVGATSLGNYVFSGLQTQNFTAIIVGCIAAALLAITIDQLIRLAELAVVRRSRLLGSIVGAAFLILLATSLMPVFPSLRARDSGQPVVIGSKPFTEQYLLAKLIDNRLTAAGMDTDLRSGMGSIILFEALADGSIDCYVDYTGTIWTNVMKRTDLPSRDTILAEMTAWLEHEHGIICPGPVGFENTYAFAIKRTLAEHHNLRTIGDLARVSSNMAMGSDYEFFQRPEWQALVATYGLEFERLVTLDPTLMYSAINQQQVDVISAYSTDGRIVAFDLVVLEDPGQALPPYDAVLLLSARAAQRHDLVEELRTLVGRIDNNLMRTANKLVDVDHVSVDSAAVILNRAIEKANK
jgi:osmoprotectant transport system permease protein